MATRRIAFVVVLLVLPLLSACADDAPLTGPDEEPTPELGLLAIADSFSITTHGFHVCALNAAGLAYCWGSSLFMELGRPTAPASCYFGAPCATVPRTVLYDSAYVQISAGMTHTCGLVAAGDIFCWGTGAYGELGNPNAPPARPQPRIVPSGGRDYIDVSAGGFHTCALDADGRAWCWGSNMYGQLGDGGDSIYRFRPARVTGSRAYTKIVAGANITCALGENQRVYCWGFGMHGQLGNGGFADSDVPVQVDGARLYRELDVHTNHACAIGASNNRAYCWGNNTSGELGIAPPGYYNTPQQVSSMQYKSIAVGNYHSCAVRTSGFIDCWGSGGNSLGQLGTGDSLSMSVLPTRVPGPRTYVGVDAGQMHTCAITAAGETYCWGANIFGQIGRPITLDTCWGQPCAVRPTRTSGNLLFE